MATYAKEKGFTVQTLSTDPAASQAATGSWSSGGSLNTGRRIGDNGAGTLPAGLVFAGYTTTAVANTESYDGSSFTETGDLNSARHACAGHGATATAAFCVGGTPGPKAYNEHFVF